MARSIGIDAGDYSVKAVEIDGSYRKTRLVRLRVERVAATPDGDERIAATALAIRTALKEGKMTGDMVLGHPSREAVLRTIDVPFTGRDAIRKVIKAEVEGAIQSHAVDDMVVDFVEVGKAVEGAKVLVVGVPKPGLRGVLDALADDGIEPEHVDMDTMALYRAADWCGAFTPPDAPPVPADSSAVPTIHTTVVLDCGARSTRVLVVTDGKLIDMRTIRIGEASIAEGVARTASLSIEDARAAVVACLSTGGDWRAEVADIQMPALAEQAGEADMPARMREATVGHAQVETEQAAYLQRLSRELTRFLTGQARAGGVQAVYVTGGAVRIPGLRPMLEEVFGMPVRDLDVIGHLQHSLSPEEVETLGPQLATAIGLALQPLGGPEGFELRQEDLAYTRGFDRVKFPLAITCMVALFAAVVYGVKLNNDLKNRHFQVGLEYPDQKRGFVFWGQLGAVMQAPWFDEVRNFALREGGKDYKTKELVRDLATLPVANRVKFVHDKLEKLLKDRQQDSGIYQDLSVESGLAVLVRFFEVMKTAEDNGLGKYLMFKFDLGMKATGTGEKSGRFVNFTIAVRGDDARQRLAILREAFEAECNKPGSPFLKYDSIGTKETSFADSTETGVKGFYFDVRLIVRESFQPFVGVKQ